MARKKREVRDEDFKRKRSRIRREERKRQRKQEATEGMPMDTSWLLRDMAVGAAMKVVNLHKERPYWLSIPHEAGDGNPPVCDFFPCTTFRTRERAYYGFLFREHRDEAIYRLDDAVKELTDTVRRIAPQLV